jgi:hypothetical protein
MNYYVGLYLISILRVLDKTCYNFYVLRFLIKFIQVKVIITCEIHTF